MFILLLLQNGSMQPNSFVMKAEADVDEVPTLVFLTGQISSCHLWCVRAKLLMKTVKGGLMFCVYKEHRAT